MNRVKYTNDMFIGKRFGKLVAIGPVEIFRDSKNKCKRRVKCKCDCGNEKFMNIRQLIIGEIKSCGCEQKKRLKDLGKMRKLGIIKSPGNLKDGRTGTKLYSTWRNMNNRCTYHCCSGYERYGGRGISVCSDWNKKNKYGWENFKNWAYMNGWDENNPDLEIDRIDNDGNYEPSNCRFVGRVIQDINKSSNVLFTYGDITKTAIEWSTALCINPQLLTDRKSKGWSDSEILTIPTLSLTENKNKYIQEHGIRPYIMINNPVYEAKYQKPFFDNEVLKKPLP